MENQTSLSESLDTAISTVPLLLPTLVLTSCMLMVSGWDDDDAPQCGWRAYIPRPRPTYLGLSHFCLTFVLVDPPPFCWGSSRSRRIYRSWCDRCGASWSLKRSRWGRQVRGGKTTPVMKEAAQRVLVCHTHPRLPQGLWKLTSLGVVEDRLGAVCKASNLIFFFSINFHLFKKV